MRFTRVIGHSTLKAKLIGNVREGRVPHAQFFLGPRGSGVLPLALGYARYLLCTDRGLADACGKCPSCVQLDKLTHPDLHLIFPIFLFEKGKTCDPLVPEWRALVLKEPYLDDALWREEQEGGENKQLRMGVDIAAEIQRKLSLKAYSGGWKVMLIWLPEFVDTAAANKLLKILEEPEPGTAILMAGHNPELMLPTILSRVQLVKVSALHEEDLVQALLARHPDLRPEEARICAVRSGGDLLEAMDLAEKNEEELFVLFRDWMRASYALKMPEAVELAERFARMGRERQKGFMRYGLHLVRMSLLQAAGAPDLVRAEGQEQEFIRRFAAMLSAHRAEGLRRELETAHQHLERNANPKVLFMDLSYGMYRLLRA